MKVEIKSNLDGTVIFEGEFGSLKIVLESAAKICDYLHYAGLRDAEPCGVELRGVSLYGADGRKIARATPEEAIANLDKVREIILDNETRLGMGAWHRDNNWVGRTCAEEAVCGTTHCLAGWLQVCSTDKNLRSIKPHIAGVFAAPVAAKMFFCGNRETLEWLRERKYADEAKDYA